MASSLEQSLAQESNVAQSSIDSGISVDLLLFGGNLVEKAFQAAMEEIHKVSDNEVTFFVVICGVFVVESTDLHRSQVAKLVTSTETAIGVRVFGKQVLFVKRLISLKCSLLFINN